MQNFIITHHILAQLLKGNDIMQAKVIGSQARREINKKTQVNNKVTNIKTKGNTNKGAHVYPYFNPRNQPWTRPEEVPL